MRNRAKCKLCGEIIESFLRDDYVNCKCGEIAIDGGEYSFLVFAKDFSNFLRIDDEGNELIVNVISKEDNAVVENQPLITKEDKLKVLEEMIKSIENLPKQALYQPITHADHYSLLLLLSSILRD